VSDDRWNSDDERAPYVDRGPRLPRVPKAPGPLVTADEIFKWLRGTFQPRMGIAHRDPKLEKSDAALASAPDLTQAKALAVEFAFSPEQCERVLIVAKRDEAQARQLLHVASQVGGPDPIGEVCFGIAELKKGTP
jgi:hypothetical protein